MAKNRVIGSKNAMPWHIPGELKRFKEITTGHPIIMGRKTFESIGRPLPNRLNIVITRDEQYVVEGAVVVNSLDEALEEARRHYESPPLRTGRIMNEESREENHDSKSLLHDSDENEIFIIGGGEIFKQAMPVADKLYLTLIEKDIEGDTYFPDYSDFHEVSREDRENDGYKYSFLELEK